MNQEDLSENFHYENYCPKYLESLWAIDNQHYSNEAKNERY